ncbi:MAG TPA: S41 family peptidase [Lentimicrobium sp.]|nr:S41 family peptidase [Lentimicrobium sp.]
MKTIKLIVILVLGINLNIFSQALNSSSFEVSKNLDILTNVLKELNNNYVDEVRYGDLMKTGIDAMLEELDPYTVFISEAEIEDYTFMTTGQYGGIGALIHKQGDYVVISEPYENSPANKAGLQAGDKILSINGKDAIKKSVSDVSQMLKGQPGTKLNLQIDRDNFKMDRVVIRENVSIPNVAYSSRFDDGTGYIKLTGFTQNSSREVKDALLKLKESGNLTGLILDLRDNGGGLLNEAVSITNLFVKKGEMVVSTKGKTPDRNKSYKTLISPIEPDLPLVVLVNGMSASASEIVAGAIQDLDRGVIVGERTFGKGLVQNIIPLSYNTQMKVTVAKYYIPSGRCIQSVDYSHRDSLGRSVSIPDSLTNPFKTKGGRTVYDGAGINPDIQVEQPLYSNISLSLLSKYLFFDYANKFRRTHDSIPLAKDFRITDEIYADFVNWLQDKDYDYVSRSEKMLADLKKTAETEQYFSELKNEFDLLESKMIHNKQADLEKFRPEIERILKNEIVARYYNQKGRVEAAITDDEEVKLAREILKDTKKYASVLDGSYTANMTKS